MGLIISTPRLILREFRKDDIQEVCDLCNDPYIVKWMPALQANIGGIAKFIEEVQKQYAIATKEECHIYEAMTFKGSDQVIGSVSIGHFKAAW